MGKGRGQGAQAIARATTDPMPKGLVPRRYPNESAAREERARLARRLGPLLERVVAERDHEVSLATDPVSFVHRYQREDDREIVALIASSLAYGNVKAIRASVERVLAVLGPRPARHLAGSEGTLARDLSGFVHRFNRGPDVAALLYAASRRQREYGGLGRLFSECWERSGGDLRQAVFNFVSSLRAVDLRPLLGAGEQPRRLAYLLPDGTGPGACKRLQMYLRWMIRGPDEVDLGLWHVPSPSNLLMPLDTHTGRICRYLGLTTRRDLSWLTAEEVTWHLAGIDPSDPVRFDFALAHLGISRACTHQRGSEGCRTCALASVCRVG